MRRILIIFLIVIALTIPIPVFANNKCNNTPHRPIVITHWSHTIQIQYQRNPENYFVNLKIYHFGPTTGKKGGGIFTDGIVTGVWFPKYKSWLIYEGHNGNTLIVNPRYHPEWKKYIPTNPHYEMPLLPQ